MIEKQVIEKGTEIESAKYGHIVFNAIRFSGHRPHESWLDLIVLYEFSTCDNELVYLEWKEVEEAICNGDKKRN